MYLLKSILFTITCFANTLLVCAQTEMSALADYVNFYKKYLHRDENSGTCAMYPSCSQYGLLVFEDCYFPKAMVYMADRMIRCGHDFDSYDLTLKDGQLLLLDFPPYSKESLAHVYDGRQYFSYTDWNVLPDSSLLFVNHLVNKQMFQEALVEIERIQFERRLRQPQLFVNKLICYKGLGQLEDAILDYEVRFPEFVKNVPEVRFKMADILLDAGNFSMAQKLLSEIADDSISVIAQKYAWLGIVNAYQENWNEASRCFSLLSNYEVAPVKIQNNLQLVQDAVLLKKKKAWLASSLSVIPGVGYIYTQRPKSALTSFVMNSLLGYAVFTSIKQKNYGVAALLGVFNVSFYIGNIFGSKRSAVQYNQQKLRDIQSTLYKNNKSIN